VCCCRTFSKVSSLLYWLNKIISELTCEIFEISLQHTATHCNTLQHTSSGHDEGPSDLEKGKENHFKIQLAKKGHKHQGCVRLRIQVLCCSVLQCVAVRHSVRILVLRLISTDKNERACVVLVYVWLKACVLNTVMLTHAHTCTRIHIHTHAHTHTHTRTHIYTRTHSWCYTMKMRELLMPYLAGVLQECRSVL